MSEDEIIKNLNDLLEHNYLEDVYYLRQENDYAVYNNSIKGLLALYKQEKEKNKKIKNATLCVVGRRTGKEATQKIYLKEYINKNKIKEIIKQLENDIKKTRDKKYRAPGEYISDYDKVRLKAYITKSEEIKNRLLELI